MGLLTQMQFYQELYLHSVSAESEVMDMINSRLDSAKRKGDVPRALVVYRAPWGTCLSLAFGELQQQSGGIPRIDKRNKFQPDSS